MRILITGSRDWPDDGSVYKAINHTIGSAIISGAIDDDELVTVVHGACPSGADDQARIVVETWLSKKPDLPIMHDPHPAKWDLYGKSAGFKRNEEMVNLGADICLAFLGPCRKHDTTEHRSEGASHTVRLCEAAGIPVIKYEADY